MFSKDLCVWILAVVLLFSGHAVGIAADDYDYDVPASFLDHLAIEKEGGVDVNGDGNPDNALGALVSLFETTQGVGLDELISTAIEDGVLVVGAAWPSFEGGVRDSVTVQGHFFELVDSDGDLQTRDAFHVDRRSFPVDSSQPRHRLTTGQVAGDELSGEATSFPLLVPFFAALLLVEVEDVRLEARVVEDDLGILVSEGTLSGVIPIAALIEAFNSALRNDCDCLGLEESQDLILLSIDEDQESIDIECNPDVEIFECNSDANALCSSLDSLCSFVGILAIVLDADTDHDGINDALSSFFSFTMVGTRLLGPFGPPDCNQNGIADAEDIESETSDDENQNGIPDECEPEVREVSFRRGDSNADGTVDISDAVFALSFLFLGGPAPACLEAANSNDDVTVDISDAAHLLANLFLGGPPPPEPHLECGFDGTPPALSCESFEPCAGVVEIWPSTRGTYRSHNTFEPLLPSEFPPLAEILDEIFVEPDVFLLRLMAANVSGPQYFEDAPWNVIFDCQGGVSPEGDCLGDVTLTSLGQTAAGVLEAMLDDSVGVIPGGETYRELLSDMSSVFDDAEDFTLSGDLGITQDPDASGLLGSSNRLRINAITWRWEESERTMVFAEDPLEGSRIEMALEYSARNEAYILNVSQFSLNLNHADLAMMIFENVVLPEAFGPEFDSLEDLFVRLVNCEKLADDLEAEGLGFLAPAIESSCEALQISSVSAVEDWLMSVTGGAESEYVLATSSSPEPCKLTVELSEGKDTVVQFGGPEVEDSCWWEGEIRLVDDAGEEHEIDGLWWAERF